MKDLLVDNDKLRNKIQIYKDPKYEIARTKYNISFLGKAFIYANTTAREQYEKLRSGDRDSADLTLYSHRFRDRNKRKEIGPFITLKPRTNL